MQPTLDFARRLSAMGMKMWIRYVLVPGYTDEQDDVERLAAFVVTLQGVERVEVLPFHKMGEDKWEKLGFDYRLKDVQPPSAELVRRVIAQFSRHGLYTC